MLKDFTCVGLDIYVEFHKNDLLVIFFATPIG